MHFRMIYSYTVICLIEALAAIARLKGKSWGSKLSNGGFGLKIGQLFANMTLLLLFFSFLFCLRVRAFNFGKQTIYFKQPKAYFSSSGQDWVPLNYEGAFIRGGAFNVQITVGTVDNLCNWEY